MITQSIFSVKFYKPAAVKLRTMLIFAKYVKKHLTKIKHFAII